MEMKSVFKYKFADTYHLQCIRKHHFYFEMHRPVYNKSSEQRWSHSVTHYINANDLPNDAVLILITDSGLFHINITRAGQQVLEKIFEPQLQ